MMIQLCELQCGFDYDILTSRVIDTNDRTGVVHNITINFNPIGVGLSVNSAIGFNLIGAAQQ